MVALPIKRIIVPLAPLIAGVLAASVALFVAVIPADMLGMLVLDSGIAALIPAAEPPLGTTARAALILIGGGGIGLVAWFAAFLLIGTRSIAISNRWIAGDVPMLRRADAHPDAPPRRPLFATQDLGTPFLDVHAPAPLGLDDDAAAGRDLPADLDLPMSVYDPRAIPPVPLAASAPQPLSAKPNRFETVAPMPFIRMGSVTDEVSEPVPIRRPARPDSDPSPSIDALLDRLEKGVTSRAPLAAAPRTARVESLQESLASLRRLAINR